MHVFQWSACSTAGTKCPVTACRAPGWKEPLRDVHSSANSGYCAKEGWVAAVPGRKRWWGGRWLPLRAAMTGWGMAAEAVVKGSQQVTGRKAAAHAGSSLSTRAPLPVCVASRTWQGINTQSSGSPQPVSVGDECVKYPHPIPHSPLLPEFPRELGCCPRWWPTCRWTLHMLHPLPSHPPLSCPCVLGSSPSSQAETSSPELRVMIQAYMAH